MHMDAKFRYMYEQAVIHRAAQISEAILILILNCDCIWIFYNFGGTLPLIYQQLHLLLYLFKCNQNIAKKSLNDADSFDDCQPSLSKLEIVKGVRSLR